MKGMIFMAKGEGKLDQIKGNVKEAAGKAVDDKKAEHEGKADQLAGKAKDAVDSASKKTKDQIDNLSE
ncbi:CsbD family protein [Nosocomiicoccus ampullae]|uniref:Uncharacterized protein YjbJ (UPF0337 family) n=2 Tax=Nosocomiicoccus ampullae TaxID=489910 RepID=A0A9Q2CYV7_9STAP|nr:CsbD family protein [Nosocomiicoccus ampullae]MBB5175630.1 uncharacterized protein YjbJ (UPF0337 family) [Nosocomiicoccus ampullae]